MLRRWLLFSTVGIVGFAVQLLILAGLMRLRVNYLAATTLAVEAAILQNFIWHEQWTWRDRAVSSSCAERLWRFHLLNGIVSLVGNLAVVRLLVGELGLSVVPANAVAVLACSTVNFAAGHRLVWTTPGSRPIDPAPSA
jgi:putative flippase GtrA